MFSDLNLNSYKVPKNSERFFYDFKNQKRTLFLIVCSAADAVQSWLAGC